MSQYQRNFKVLVSKDVTVDATSLADLAEGELCAIKPDGTLLTAGETIADAPYITIIRGGAAATFAHKFSNKIVGANVTGWRGTERAAAVEQVSYVGWNGTTAGGLFNVVNSSEYEIVVNFLHDKVIGSERPVSRKLFYTSDASATQAEIATGLAASVAEDSWFDTAAAPKTTALIRIAITTNGADRGISFTGKAQTYNYLFGYEQVSFSLSINGAFTVDTMVTEFGYYRIAGVSTASAVGVSPDPGVGAYVKVTDLENAAKGYDGITNRTKFPVPSASSTFQAESTESYDVYVIDHLDRHASADLGGTVDSPMQEIIAIPYDAAALNGGAFELLINPWMASCPGNFAPVML